MNSKYKFLDPTLSKKIQSYITTCLLNTSTWMFQSHLKFNMIHLKFMISTPLSPCSHPHNASSFQNSHLS